MHVTTNHPIKIRSRTIPKRRRRMQRFYALMLTTAFGFGCYSALTPSAPFSERNQLTSAEPALLPPSSQALIAAATDTADATPLVVAEKAPDPAMTSSPAPVVAAAPPLPSISYPLVETLTIASGDNFVSLLGKSGVSSQDARDILDAMGKKFSPKDLRAGNKVQLTLDKAESEATPRVTKLSLPVSSLASIEVSRSAGGNYNVKQVEEKLVTKLARAGGTIDSSLYETIVDSGMPVGMVSELIKAFSYDVDFQREIRPGNKIDVVFERKQTESGKAVGYGNIVYASLSIGGRDLRIYRYTDKDGNGDYYTAKGESVRKALLRTPINGARISSGFGMRNHPILGYSKMHKGVDFAAVTGTPVYASGDGVVNFVGRKGGYGNYVQITHNKQYASAYAHLSRFATGIAPGKKVKQGQIIAYVGSTGASTGPHLHYEILMAGNQVNPANVKFKTGNALAGKELASFKRSIETLHAQLDSMPKNGGKLAMLDSSFGVAN